ncbi:MAG TPA: C4-type zinc ribbon domain-containing protein, partial [Kofleriaceae bacterium]|nr:C4-type zinc ribbon domain-containing protein [Kofleriaceae bacterium]
KSIEALPERLRPAKQDLAKLEAMLQQEREQVADTDKWRAEQEELVRRDEEAVRQAKSKLQQSRNTKDFAAANREVENKRRMISEREEELLKVITAMEATRAQLAQREKDVEALRQHVATEEATVASRTAELTSELEQQESGREGLASQVPGELLRRYEQVQRRRGIALVPVVDGICKGCFMSLPPQLSNIIARCTTLESCPSCQRLLYRLEMMPPAEAEGDGSTAP